MTKELVATAELAARRGGEVLLEWYGRSDLVRETKAKNDFVSEADREAERAVLEVITKAHPDHAILAEESGESPGAQGEADGAGSSSETPDRQWVVDPLDGTANFLHGLEIFAVSVACVERSGPIAAAVYAPSTDQMFVASRGGGAFRNGEAISMRPTTRLSDAFLATGFPFRMHRALDLYLEMFKQHFENCRGIRRCGSAALDLAHVAAGVYDGFFEMQLAPWDIAAGTLLIQEAGGVVSDFDGRPGMPWAGNIVCAAPAVHRAMLEIIQSVTTEEDLARLFEAT